MKISILTLFPEMFRGPFAVSMIKRAQLKNLVDLSIVNIRDFATDKHKSVDDKPYGGGVGMIMRVDVVDRAITATLSQSQIPRSATAIILTDPKGNQFTQAKAKTYSQTISHLLIVCGHYEGCDARLDRLVDEKISVGPYVLTGGEIPAMIVVDSVVRLIPGVLTQPAATTVESFSDPDILEYPQYTRPETYQGQTVPEILLSGNHAEIEKWQKTHVSHIRKPPDKNPNGG
jgi:tRNA (guanine37-N1)-methyltransferase